MRQSLHVVPEVAPRALGLIRVSKERDGTISPEVQRTAITDYAAARGYQVTGWLEGIDESGSRARSAWWPRLEQAVSSVETGEYDVILVWEFSRAARHRLRWAAAIDRVETAGGRLESATERVDVTTASGRFQRGVLSEMHAYRAEAIGEGWKSAHATRVRAGKPATGKPKYGYTYDRERKLHVPDPETGPVLADLYRRYIAGESFYQLVRWLNAHGWRTTDDGLWTERSLRRVLDSGFASGRFLAGGNRQRRIEPTLHQGVHEPLISDRVWQAYLDARGRRRAQPARAARSQYLLSGLVRCGRCRGPMVAGQFGNARAPKYRCKSNKEFGPEVCRGGYVMAAFVEREVLAWLQERADRVDAAKHDKAAMAAARVTAKSEADRLAREARKIEEALTRLVVQNATAPLPPVVYDRARAELADQLAELTAALEDAQRDRRAFTGDPGAIARGLVATWDQRPVEHRRETLRRLIRRVEVWTGRPRARVEIVPVWAPEE